MPYQPTIAIPTALAVMERLRERWSGLSDDTQAKLSELFATFMEALQSATDNVSKVKAALAFLNGVTAIPEARTATDDILQRAWQPVTRKGPPPVPVDISIDRDALDGLLDILSGAPGVAPTAGREPKSANGGESALPAPQFIRRYPDVYFPEEVMVGKRVPLTVQLRIERPPDVEPSLSPELKIEATGPMEVEAVLRALDFEIEGDHFQKILILPTADSNPIIFWVKALHTGEKQLNVEFYQSGRFLGRVTATTQVVEQPRATGVRAASLTGALDLPAHTPAPPDLELSIRYVGESETLMEFELHSNRPDVGYYRHKVGRVQFRGSPATLLENRFRELSELARPDESVAPEFIQRRLISLGNQLYDELFPEELKHEYWTWKGKGIRTIQITSEEPYIPWEMIKPYRRDATQPEPFLCEQFVLARWLCGRQGLKDNVPATSICAVVPLSDLEFVRDELDYLSTLNRRIPALQVQAPFPSAWTDVVKLLERGGFGILHFACHGNFIATDPNESAIRLDGGLLRPSDIVGEMVGFAKDTPLIFINACETGRIGFSLTRLGGWADRFVQAGCSAFIGCIWEVNDELAVNFVKTFYDRLLSGVMLGEAMQSARHTIRDQSPGNSSWLAYTLYGDPLSRVRF